LLLGFIFSTNQKKINFSTVLLSLFLQFIFGFFVLYTNFGFLIFSFLGNLATSFLELSNYGSEFVFGKNFKDHLVAFSVLIFFINYLVYLLLFSLVLLLLFWIILALQSFWSKFLLILWFILLIFQVRRLFLVLQIFFWVKLKYLKFNFKAPLLIRPFISKLTLSELSLVMCSGFATIAGSVLG
jgi:concentrative nucleoside transporter, CNT family